VAGEVESHGAERILGPVPSLPRVLLIDLDDTILRYGAGGEGLWIEVAERFAPRLPVAPARLLAALDAVRGPFWADPARSRLARQDMFAARRVIVAQAFERLGLSPEGELVREVADAFSSEREARVAPFPGALQTLAELRRRGHAIGLLTNGGAKLQRAKLERYDLARCFDVVRIEGEVGVGKPEAAAFAGALAALGATGEPAMMIGDDLDADVAGGSRAGLATVWVDHAGAGPPRTARPDHVVRALAELLDRI
jgi:putative hydrolase of the HAD superfamily